MQVSEALRSTHLNFSSSLKRWQDMPKSSDLREETVCRGITAFVNATSDLECWRQKSAYIKKSKSIINYSPKHSTFCLVYNERLPFNHSWEFRPNCWPDRETRSKKNLSKLGLRVIWLCYRLGCVIIGQQHCYIWDSIKKSAWKETQ